MNPLALLLDQIQSQHPPPENPRRNGKIARLPLATRLRINRMLDDGLPFRAIMKELGDAATDINPQNLTNWVHGGYQDYLSHQELTERAQAQAESAAHIIGKLDAPDPALIPRALDLIASNQILTAIMDHGEHTLKSMLHQRPTSYLTLMNTLCHLSSSTINLSHHRKIVSARRKKPVSSLATGKPYSPANSPLEQVPRSGATEANLTSPSLAAPSANQAQSS